MRRVVVTGMGVVSPIGNDTKTYWDSLKSGRCGIDFITRFDTQGHKVRIAAEVKDFDPLRYMDKSELRRTDLNVQYAIAAAGQAIGESGLSDVDPERLGVYIGSGIGGIGTFEDETRKLIDRGPSRVSPFFVPMIIGNIAAGVVAIRFRAQGPCLPVVTACATSSHAIGEAYRAIHHGYADAIISGGCEAAITPLALAGFTNCKALTERNDPMNASIPFDARRDGFVMGEGAAILILEALEHAQARGAEVFAEVVGYGNTCDAYHITAPQPEALACAKAIRLALAGVDMDAAQSVYINAHGTSTQLNDKTETMAIRIALGEHASKALVSSTKSMTGHMLGAAGAAEAIAAILALRDCVIPPTIGYSEPDPECDLDYVPGHARAVRADIALSQSLGFGGHNACLAFKRF